MMDERTPRPENSEIALNGTVYTLHHASVWKPGIIYSATAANAGTWEDVVIREVYPQWAVLTRQEDGTLEAAAAGRDILLQARKTAASGQQAEDLWLRPCGGRSELVDACGTSYVVRIFPKAFPLQAMLKQGPMPAWAALALTEQLLEMVETIHCSGLLHLQIAPALLYLEPNGRLILDYHFLYPGRQLEVFGGPARKTPYEAPEVRMGYVEEISQAADLYSCCAVLFEMLAGRPLQEDEIIGRQLCGTLQHVLSGCTPTQRANLANFLRCGLHVLPHRRFPSAAMMRSIVPQLTGASRHAEDLFCAASSMPQH